MFLKKVVDEVARQMLEFQNKQVSTTQENEFISKVKDISSITDGSAQAKGFKKKEGRKGGKRLKGRVEIELSKKRKKDGSRASKMQEPTLVLQMIELYNYYY